MGSTCTKRHYSAASTECNQTIGTDNNEYNRNKRHRNFGIRIVAEKTEGVNRYRYQFKFSLISDHLNLNLYLKYYAKIWSDYNSILRKFHVRTFFINIFRTSSRYCGHHILLRFVRQRRCCRRHSWQSTLHSAVTFTCPKTEKFCLLLCIFVWHFRTVRWAILKIE